MDPARRRAHAPGAADSSSASARETAAAAASAARGFRPPALRAAAAAAGSSTRRNARDGFLSAAFSFSVSLTRSARGSGGDEVTEDTSTCATLFSLAATGGETPIPLLVRLGCEGTRGALAFAAPGLPPPGLDPDPVGLDSEGLPLGLELGTTSALGGGFPNRRPMVPSPKSHEGAAACGGGAAGGAGSGLEETSPAPASARVRSARLGRASANACGSRVAGRRACSPSMRSRTRRTSASLLSGASAMNRALARSRARGLRPDSFCRHCATNSLNAGEKSPSSLGGGFFGMKNSTRIGCMSLYGGDPVAISMAVIPRLHTSALLS
mmetsp:Transcript_2539/g.10617  ORF Transcript_2539/g.10617 Transcript_2539/m.10617 type:complete len:325 (-) Transcript_2539:623-1597(-)